MKCFFYLLLSSLFPSLSLFSFFFLYACSLLFLFFLHFEFFSSWFIFVACFLYLFLYVSHHFLFVLTHRQRYINEDKIVLNTDNFMIFTIIYFYNFMLVIDSTVQNNDNEISLHFNSLNPELNPICHLLALLAHHFLHVSRIRVKLLTIRLLMSYIYMEHLFLMFLDHTQRRTTVGRTPLDE